MTSGFLHANGAHLGMNMFSLYFFGPWIEWSLGGTQFLVIYFAAIVGGNLLSLLVHRHHDYRAYGARAGCRELFWRTFSVSRGRHSILPGSGSHSVLAVRIAFLAASFYGMKNQIGNVGHDAHLGGALVGMYTAAAMHPGIIPASPKLFAAISIGTILLMVYLARKSLFLPAGGIPFPKFAKPAGATPACRSTNEPSGRLTPFWRRFRRRGFTA